MFVCVCLCVGGGGGGREKVRISIAYILCSIVICTCNSVVDLINKAYIFLIYFLQSSTTTN